MMMMSYVHTATTTSTLSPGVWRQCGAVGAVLPSVTLLVLPQLEEGQPDKGV